PATHAAGSMYLVAKTLLDLNHKSGLDLGDIICKDKSSQPPSGKQSSGEASWATKPCAQSYAATGGAMPPPEDPEEDSKDPKKQDGTYKTPDEKHEHIFERIKRANGAMENKLDGSIWEKDATSHGGRQYKRWDNIRSWQKREQPKSIWPDGRIRK
ncbi:MAG: hypothetical protein Q8K36_06935, partial [Alphaproteobacteria bacterium]|nr:hypothetical protein [Alphaproteobacteria bacterium]